MSLASGLHNPLVDPEDQTNKNISTQASTGVPRREQLLHVSWIFLFASLTLLMSFVMLYTDWPTAEGGNIGLGITFVSSVEWLHGFIILTHWTYMLPGPVDVLAMIGCLLKTLASVLFCVFPITALYGEACAWSNFVGILFFHSGNMVDTFNMMRNSCNYKQCCAQSNFPTITIWVLLTATTFLVTGNALVFVQGNGGLQNVSDDTLTIVEGTGQITGSLLLTIGSMMCIWSSRNIKPVDGE